MSPTQLSSFLANVQNYAASQLTPIQQTSQAAEAANGLGTPSIPVYSGQSLNPGDMQGGVQNSTGTAVAGSALSAGASFFQSLLGAIGGGANNAVSEGVAGYIGGKAAQPSAGAAAALLE